MQEDRLIKFDGSIVEVLPDAQYRVRFANGHEVIARTTDGIEKPNLPNIAAERVTIEISPSDSTTGRLVFHHGF